MARRCLCGRLLAAVHDDPRLRTLPLGARMLFVLVAESAARSPVCGVLPFSETRRVSLLVSAPETEVETHLQTLRAEGLITAGPDGGLAVPLLAEGASRAEAARRNGAAGGRPRKGESREDYLRRRQASMLLPLPAAAPPSETQETEPGKPVARATTTTTCKSIQVSEVGSSPPPARDAAPGWVSLGEEVAELAGLDPARGGYDFRPVQGWLEAGASPDAIRAAVGRVAGRPGYAGVRVTSLRYFDRAVQEERGRQAAPPRIALPSPDEEARFAAAEALVARVLRGGSAAAA